MSGLNQIIAAFFGALGFAFLFNLHGKEIFYTSLGGCLAWCVYLSAGLIIPQYGKQYFAAALFLGIYAVIFCSQDKGSRDIISCGRHDPPDPGGSIIYDDAECI